MASPAVRRGPPLLPSRKVERIPLPGEEILQPEVPEVKRGQPQRKKPPTPPKPVASRRAQGQAPLPEMPEQKAQEPRYLLPKEIEDIVDVLPRVTAAVPAIAKKVREEIKSKLAMQLGEMRISPTVIPKLKGWIVNQFHRSAVQPGEALGIRIGESIGQPASQMNLSSFHHTGSMKSQNMGIDGMRELFNASQRRRHEISTIHFKNKSLSFDEVLELRRTLVGVTIGDLAKHYTIEPNHNENGIIPLIERGWWYDMFVRIALPARGHKFPVEEKQSFFLRMTLDTTMLYTYKVTLEDVAIALEANLPASLFCIYSPSSEGVVDIYPIENKIEATLIDELKSGSTRVRGIRPDNASLLFLKLFVGPRLVDYVIKGMKGITHIFPVEVTTWSIVRSEVPALPGEKLEAQIEMELARGVSKSIIDAAVPLWKRTWILHLDTIRMRMTGITYAKLRDLFARASLARGEGEGKDYEIQVNQIPTDLKPGERPAPGTNLTQVSITMPEGWETAPHMPEQVKPDELKPGLYISQLIKVDEDRLEEEAKRKRKHSEDKRKAEQKAGVPANRLTEIPYTRRVPTPLILAGTYVYAESKGTNLRKLLAHPLIDPLRTISNNLHEILDVLGVEAVRNYITREFYDLIIGNTAYINPRYIASIADFMTNMGILVPITSRGVARQHRGALADASFEHPMEIFKKAATSGRWDDVVSTSAAIFLGQRIRLGTGGMAIGLREDVLKEIEQRIAASGEKQIERQAVEKDLGDILTDDQLEGSGMRHEESDVGTVEDIINAPSPFKPQPGVGGGPVPPQQSQMLAPKGPIPRVIPSVIPLAPWVAAIIGAADVAVDDSGLPPLHGIDFAALVGLARQAPAQEQEVQFMNADALMALNQ